MQRIFIVCVALAAFIFMPFLGMFYSPSIPFKPNFPAITDFVARQEAFIVFMIPKIDFANAQTLQIRTQIQNIIHLWQENGKLSYSQRSWLHEIADVYKIPDFNINRPADINELLSRVDAVPSSLVLAQAANESGWGTSRFALLADNFFGQHCNIPGCGIVPSGRPAGKTYEVQKFKNVQSAINDYIYNLNTNPAYANFRVMRASLRAAGQPVTGYRLAPYLISYSVLGKQYTLIISDIIINHNLMQYDSIST